MVLCGVLHFAFLFLGWGENQVAETSTIGLNTGVLGTTYEPLDAGSGWLAPEWNGGEEDQTDSC